MNKDVRNLISEAFEELYQEMVNEAISNEDVGPAIQKALQTGEAVDTDFAGEDELSRRNFDRIIEALVMEYKESGNPNAKSAIQLSYYPNPNSKMYRAVAGQFITNPKIKEAMASAYEQIVIKSFDKTVERYEPGTSGIGAMFTNLMRGRIHNFIVQGYSGNREEDDRFDTLSIDNPIGDSGETFADRLSKNADDSGEYQKKEERLTKQQEILDTALNLLYNTFDDEGNKEGKREVFTIQQLIKGKSIEEVFEMVNNNPEFPPYSEPRVISQRINRFLVSKEVKEVEDIISGIYNTNFKLSNVDYARDLKKSSLKKQKAAEMGAAQDEKGNMYEPQYSKSSVEDWEELTGEPYFENYKNIDIDVLMERVLKRLSILK